MMRTNHRSSMLRALAVLAGAAWLMTLGATGCSIEGTTPPAESTFTPSPGPEPWTPPGPQAQARKLVILHTNDEHSQLLGFGPQSMYPWLPKIDGTVDPVGVLTRLAKDTQTVGGIVRRQFMINKIRSESSDPVLVLSAGDMIMGTLLHAATPKAAPDFVAMATLGYDFTTLGNHEFDWGSAQLTAAIAAAKNTTFGGAVPMIASNIHFDDVGANDTTGAAALKMLYSDQGNSGAPIMPWATKTLQNGLKVGFLGGMGFEAAMVAPLKAPISFSTPRDGTACSATSPCTGGKSCIRSACVDTNDATAHIAAMVADLQPLVDRLRNTEKVDLVVLLSHSGKTEDAVLAAMNKGIDVIIGGHSHDEMAPLTVQHTQDSGSTVVVQAGEYGKKLGQLTLTVGTDGKVSVVADQSKLIPIDHTIDAQILAGSNLLATPPVIAPPLESAFKLTGGLIGPVVAGINKSFKDAHIADDIFAPAVYSDHDIIGETAYKDTNLSQLFTDAARGVVAVGACLNPAVGPIVAVEANGVLRQSLRFTPPDTSGTTPLPGSASFADLFSVVPLGASPFADASVASPGYPMVTFAVTAAQLFGGIDVGVTKGLASDSFFLSYAGMRVTYDPALAPFNPSTGSGGRATKIELYNDATASWTTIFDYAAGTSFATRWQGINPMAYKIQIVTNLYMASFMAQLGLTPLDASGNPIQHLWDTALCIDMAQQMAGGADCASGKPVIVKCVNTPNYDAQHVKWFAPEVKEWLVLHNYLKAMPGQTIPSPAYKGELPASPRVKTQ